MIHPSYSELIQAINTNSEDDDNTMLLNSRYSLVLATSKRARQLIGGAKPLVDRAEGKKALSVAIDELYQGKVKILAKEPGQENVLESVRTPSQISEASLEPESLAESWEDTEEPDDFDEADDFEDLEGFDEPDNLDDPEFYEEDDDYEEPDSFDDPDSDEEPDDYDDPESDDESEDFDVPEEAFGDEEAKD